MVNDELLGVLLEEIPSGLAGMVACTILDQDKWAGDLVQQVLQKDLVAVTVEALLNALVVEPTREEFDHPKFLVAFADAAGLDMRLLSFGCPGIAQRSHWAKLTLSPK